jgi:hypothetical protein
LQINLSWCPSSRRTWYCDPSTDSDSCSGLGEESGLGNRDSALTAWTQRRAPQSHQQSNSFMLLSILQLFLSVIFPFINSFSPSRCPVTILLKCWADSLTKVYWYLISFRLHESYQSQSMKESELQFIFI